MTLMGIFFVILCIQRAARCRKEHLAFLPFMNRNAAGERTGRFFIPGWDKMRFLGTIVLFILYGISMQFIHFLPASIIFVFLFNIVYSGVFTDRAETKAMSKKQLTRSLVNSFIISVVGSVLIWFLFAKVFVVTLP
jgi:hypothetical protein